MSFYEYMDPDICNEQALQAGRAAHVCRNYVQGFTNLGHPEFLTIDGLMGQIEGQFRVIRSHLIDRKDIKPQIKLIARSSRFVQKILKASFIDDNALSENDLDELRDLTGIVNQLILRIDQEINAAILKESSSLFNIELPKIKIENPPLPDVLAQFNSGISEALVRTEEKFNNCEKKSKAVTFSKMMSNKAHSTQDLVAEHIQQPIEKDHANQIINLAGGIENESRAIIAQFNSQPTPNIQNIQKNIASACDLVTKIRQLAEAQNFAIKDKTSSIMIACEFQLKIIESLKLIL